MRIPDGIVAQNDAGGQHEAMPKATAIPRFFLYGEPPVDVELDFLHVERIRSRSGKHDWLIPPHAHPEHTQILLVQQNGGSFRVDGRDFPARAPCLMLIPVGMVHAITFSPDTDGVVATIANAYLRDVARVEPALLAVIRTPCSHFLAPGSASLPELSSAFEALLREFKQGRGGIAGPSANKFGHVSPTTANELQKDRPISHSGRRPLPHRDILS